MGRKYKKKLVKVFSIFVSLLMVFALLPTTVSAAMNETIYEAEGISIKVTNTHDAAVPKTIHFKVLVNGETVLDNKDVEVPTANTQINVNAEEYDVYFETTNKMEVVSGVNNNYNLGFGAPSEYNCTIHLTTSKTKDNIDIQDGDTVYGTFSWSKLNATTSACPRDIEIYVDGKYAYTQTVYTPITLSNQKGDNDEFSFKPANNFNPTYKMDKDYIDDLTQKTLRIDLTTKCGCGLETCLCEGGCDCPINCDCSECTGTNLKDNEINTGYGILQYDKSDEENGYKLKVIIKVNGNEVFQTDELRVSMGLPGNLKFTPTTGKYYFQTPNSYDISTKNSNSSWIKGTGHLIIIGTSEEARNFDNVLTINLISFDNSVSLDVERDGNAAMSQVIGYRVSYTLDDTDYTYDYYNFSAAQVPEIPTNTPVKITAICNVPYEVNEWESSFTYVDHITLEGSEGQEGTKAYGNSVIVTVNSVSDTRIILRIKNVETVNAPTDDDLIDPETGLLKDNAVTIDCVNEQENHENKTYGLKEGTYKIGDLAGNSADGYTCDITITNPNSYVDDYNEVLKGHVLDPKEQNREITLRYVNGKWTVGEGEAPVKYTVKCETDPGTTIPEKPDNPTVEELLINNAVSIDCINNEVNHPNKTYGLLGKYTIGEVTDDETKGYKVDITVEPDEAYVIQYNEDTGVQHSLLPEQQEAKVITLVYDDGQWALEEGYTPVTYTVICDSDSGDQTDPSDPTNPDDDNPVNPGGDDGNQGGNDNTDDGNGNNTGNTNDNGNNTGNTDNDGNINGSGNTGNNGNNDGQSVNTGNNANNGNGTGTNGTGTTSSTNSSQNPKTSDDSAIVTWMSLVVLAAGGIAVITKKTLKKNK